MVSNAGEQRKMNIILWVIQVILCVKFLSVAYSHGLQRNNAEMDQSIRRFGKYGPQLHKTVAAITFLVSIAILFPAIIGMTNAITIASSAVLAVMMLFSLAFHIRGREKPILIADVILMLLSAFVVYGRWVLSPL
jgi:hypothetical protein